MLQLCLNSRGPQSLFCIQAFDLDVLQECLRYYLLSILGHQVIRRNQKDVCHLSGNKSNIRSDRENINELALEMSANEKTAAVLAKSSAHTQRTPTIAFLLILLIMSADCDNISIRLLNITSC